MVAPACPAGLETAAQLPPAAPTDMCAAAAAVLLCLQVEASDLQWLEERIRNINSMAQVK